MNEPLTLQALADQRSKNVELLQRLADAQKVICDLHLEIADLRGKLYCADTALEQVKELGLLDHLRMWWNK